MTCPDCGFPLRENGTCGNLCEAGDYDPGEHCEQCGEPASHLRRCRDITPTDRGDWVQEYDEWQCDACDREWKL